MKILLLCVLAAWETAATQNFLQGLTENVVYATPSVALFAKENGSLIRCVQESPGKCEVFYEHEHHFIHNLLIAGEYLFVGLANDEVLRCDPNVKYSCQRLYRAGDAVCSLAASRGHLYIGLHDGTIVLCELELDQPNCRHLYERFEPLDDEVYGLTQVGEYLYAGLLYGVLHRCDLKPVVGQKCCTSIQDMRNSLQAVANLADNIYAVTWNGSLWKCSDSACEPTDRNRGGYRRGMKAFNGSLYVHNYKGLCKVTNNGCESYEYDHPRTAYNIAMAYGTHHLQSKYKNEDKRCKGNSQCQLVVYYNGLQRAAFEVHIKNRRLYNSNDSLVDTSNADQGYAGSAAIFAMGPDGKILLFNRRGSIQTSSFFAGNPVSGAGEMVVENGVVKK